MKIYLSGPITDNPNYREQFGKVAAELRKSGHEVFDPTEIAIEPSSTRADWMRRNIRAVLDSEMVVMLPEWQRSKGASLEYDVAKECGIRVQSWVNTEDFAAKGWNDVRTTPHPNAPVIIDETKGLDDVCKA